MKNSKNPSKFQNLKAKLLSVYYGNPIKDMKLICVTGVSGTTTVAHFIHEILGTAGHSVAVMASDQDITMGTLYKFLSEAWKANATHVIITTSLESLKKGIISNLPVHMTVVTNLNSNSDELQINSDYLAITGTHPEIAIINQDDPNINHFTSFVGTKSTITYGQSYASNIQIENSRLYKKGSEAHINIGGTRFTVASFLVGESTIHCMAAAVAAGNALHVTPDQIADGIANYSPEV